MISPAAIVILAIILPALIYVTLAFRENRRGLKVSNFFPLERFIGANEYGRSTAAAGVSLATVVLALVNLAPIVGIALVVTIASYVGGFALLYWAAPTILRENPSNLTLQAYLGAVYRSPRLKYLALVFSFIGYVSIFSMELIVGVTVLEPIFPDTVLLTSSLFLAFIVAYSAIGGFRAIVATEQWQIRFVLIAVGCLALVAALLWSETRAISIGDGVHRVVSSWQGGWGFVLGIVALNVPAAISDAGSWQRLCATRSEGDARQGLRRAMVLFATIWGSLIIASCFITVIGQAAGAFDPSSQTLMTFVINYLADGDALKSLLLFAFALGLFAALITTADSLLLVAAQMVSLDILGLDKRADEGPKSLRTARMVLVLVASTSFGLFILFRVLGLDVVQLVFAIYGAQLALFPATAMALLSKHYERARLSGSAAMISIAGGFAAAWAMALYGRFSNDTAFVFNAPVGALGVSLTLLIGLSILTRPRADQGG